MRHILVVLACLVILGGLGFAGHQAWNSERGQLLIKQTSQRLAEKRRKEAVDTEYKRLNEVCHNQQAFYDAQSVAYHKANQRPVCDLKMVE